ncbi:MAG: MMPL family transporter, partial [Opitutaceae bacterium]|nr:MMPL family transporter [Verrucomicrobiales bacterium]
LPPLTRNRSQDDASPDAPGSPTGRKSSLTIPARSVWWLTALTLAAAAVLLAARPPVFDRSPNALRPKNSQAFAAIEEIKIRMGTSTEPMWIMIEGRDELEVARRLASVERGLQQAVSNQFISTYTLSSALWPKPEAQVANRPALQSMADRRDALLQAAAAEGFTDNALVMTRSVLDVWQRAAATKDVFWPTNANSRWIFDKVFVQKPGEFLALGMLYPATNQTISPKHLLAELKAGLPPDGVLISGWELLGPAMAELVMDDLPLVFVPILALVTLTLWLAFRSWKEVVLSLVTQVFSFLLLAIVMSLADWKWNMMNLMALPLLLGMGVDFAIHTQLALHRYEGNREAVRGSIGKALLLAGSTTVAGFAAIAFSSNAGMASLGRVCGAGILCALITAVFFLPVWWQRWIGRTFKSAPHSSGTTAQTPALSGPSPMYRAEIWRFGLFLARTLPHSAIRGLARLGAGIYWICCPARREVVIQNLLTPLLGDRDAATRHARELFREFAVKLADLWRYESGLPIDAMFGEWTGWSHFEAAQTRKRGVLLLTPHLGNWEFGAPLLAQRGINLLVITLAEPHGPLTKLRQESRARWGIETLVIGQDPFAFVEVIRRLEGGATVALLVDRPPASTAVTVELFGQPFAASKAAAELARASGCILLPVYLPRTTRGYAAHILPEIPYDRAALRSPEERRKLTQVIMIAFAPAIQSHLSQWYHFVPVWPEVDDADSISTHR